MTTHWIIEIGSPKLPVMSGKDDIDRGVERHDRDAEPEHDEPERPAEPSTGRSAISCAAAARRCSRGGNAASGATLTIPRPRDIAVS